MVLKYMMSDADYQERKIIQPEINAVRPKRKPSPLKKRKKFWLLLAANLLVYSVFFSFWIDSARNRIWELLTANRSMVSGIIYNAEEPCAIIYGEVVHEGDKVNGYRVVRIYKDKVELEKDGQNLVKAVH